MATLSAILTGTFKRGNSMDEKKKLQDLVQKQIKVIQAAKGSLKPKG